MKTTIKNAESKINWIAKETLIKKKMSSKMINTIL